MKPSQMVQALVSAGHPETKIAAETGLSQSTVNRMRRGRRGWSDNVDLVREYFAKVFPEGFPAATSPPPTIMPAESVGVN